MRAIALTVASCTKRRFQCRRFGQGSGWIRSIRASDCGGAQASNSAASPAIQADVADVVRLDLRQDLRHAVDIGLAADEADVRKGLRLRDQMLAAAESDFEPDIVDCRRRTVRRARAGAGVAISSARCGSRLSIRSAWWMRSLWPLRRPKNEPCACADAPSSGGASRSPVSRGGSHHRSVWYSRYNSRARGSIEEMYICS